MPFVTLLLMVFLYKHLLSLLTFFWLTSLLHDANERIRGQSLLKENRSRKALLSVSMLLCAQLICLFLLNGPRLCLQLQYRAVTDLSAEPLRLPQQWDAFQEPRGVGDTQYAFDFIATWDLV